MTQSLPVPAAAPPERVALRRGADVYTVDAADAPTMLAQGFTPASDADVADAQYRASIADSPLAAVSAASLGALRTATFGLSDAAITGAAGALGGEDVRRRTAETLQAFQEAQPTASLAGEAAGLFAPGAALKLARVAEGGSLAARATAGAARALAAPAEGAALAGEAAAAAARRAVGATLGEGATGLAARLAQRAIPGAAQGAVEAGLFGAGQAISQAAIKDEPLTAEAIAAAAGHAALLGGGIGGGIGALSGIGSAAAERAAQALRRETVTAERTAAEAAATRAETRAAEREATETTTRTTVEEPVAGAQATPAEQLTNQARGVLGTAREVAGESAQELYDVARGTVREAVQGAREAAANAPEALQAFARERALKSTGALVKEWDELERMGEAVRERTANMLLDEAPAAVGKKSLAQLSRSDIQEAASALKSRATEQIKAPLRAADAAGAAKPKWDNVLRAYQNDIRPALLDNIGGEALAKRVDELVDDIGERVADASFDRFHRFRAKFDRKIKWAGQTGESEIQEALRGLRGAYEGEVQRALADNVSAEAAQAYRAAKTDYQAAQWLEKAATRGVRRLEQNRSISITDYLTGIVGAGVGGLGLGIPMAAAGAVANKVARERGNQILATLATRAADVRGIQGVADRVVTKLDVGLDRVIRAGEAAASAPSRASSVARGVRRTVVETTTKASREKEYQRTVSSVRAAASDERATAQRVEQALGPVASVAPNVSRDAVSTVLRGAAFLNAKIPVAALRADSVSPHLDEPRASADEQARFLRYARAVNDPQTVVDDMAQGKLTREAAEAVRVVYPRLYQQMQATALRRLAELRKPMGYPQRVQLSILLGVPADPSLSPERLSQLQGTYGSPVAENAAPSGGGVPSDQPGPQLRNKLTISQEFATATQATEAQ